MKTQKSSRKALIYDDLASLGSWVLPCGNIIEAQLSSAGTGQYALDWTMKGSNALTVTDLKAFADFFAPDAQLRAEGFGRHLDYVRTQATSGKKGSRP